MSIPDLSRQNPWSMIPVETPVGALVGLDLLVRDEPSGDSAVHVVRVAPGKVVDTFTLLCTPLGSTTPPARLPARRSQTLQAALAPHLGFALDRAMIVPASRLPGDAVLERPGAKIAVSIPLFLSVLVASFVSSTGVAVTVGAMMLMTLAALILLARKTPPAQVLDGPAGVPLPVDRAVDQMQGALDVGGATASGRRPDHATVSELTQRIDHLKATYGGLLSDVVYRIENSALFDNAVSLTRDFQLLLMQWNDESDRLAPSERDGLARRLELAFATARQHAETVGLSHLPETARADGERAAKAARLATRASSDGERRAALDQAMRLLSSLALYYLPAADDVPRMLGGEQPKLLGPGEPLP